MTRLARCALWFTSIAAAAAVVALASLTLAVASVGVFRTAGDAWVVELRVGGVAVRANAIGLVRLATLPGVAHLVDGRSYRTESGTLRFSRDDRAMRIRCDACRLRHAALASTAITTDLSLELMRDEDVLTGAVSLGEVHITFTGRLSSNAIDLAWQLPPTDVAALYRLFGDAIPETTFARIEGTFTARGAVSLPSRRGTTHWKADGLSVEGLGTGQLQYGVLRFACTATDGTRRLVSSGDGEKSWTPADAMGPYLAAAVLTAEDQRFREHPGYDVTEIDAVLDGLDTAGRRRGASTITQQLARTLYTGGERTAARKLRELLYAIEMESTLGKPRILELYLNTVDWGPGLCGAKAAARAYFNKAPARLTAIEAAWLAGALRNPHAAWERQFAMRQPERDRAVELLMQMREFPKRERQRMAKQPLDFAPVAKATRTATESPSGVATRTRPSVARAS